MDILWTSAECPQRRREISDDVDILGISKMDMLWISVKRCRMDIHVTYSHIQLRQLITYIFFSAQKLIPFIILLAVSLKYNPEFGDLFSDLIIIVLIFF